MNNEFKNRRKKILQKIRENSSCIIFSGEEKYRNNDVTYKFRQSSNFFYLTGINDHSVVLILTKYNKKTSETLVCQRPNDKDRIWTGQIPSSSSYKSKYDLNNVIYFDQLDTINFNKIENLYYEFHDHSRIEDFLLNIDNSISSRYSSNSSYLSSRLNLSNLIYEMRLIKTKHEIDQIKHAASVSAQAHINLMKTCKPNLKEYQIESDFIRICMDNKCDQAYPAIIASGKNGTVLHYTKNNSNLKANQLLLVDAAAECNNYASDITRTIPISGKFNQYQKLIYNIVLKAQTMAIKSCIENQTLINIHNVAVRYIVKGLLGAKILKGTLENNIKNEKYKKFYMHNTGHWLGLDVHDPCPYIINGEPVKLRPGMIFTVEPGIYISNDSGIDKNYHNIAVRIEDDILITKNGPYVLSQAVPKTVSAIETIMSHG
tara:strand:- start:556 stop:1848 length:1293 start_codon:yes stop_codon:yes gene_type:complete